MKILSFLSSPKRLKWMLLSFLLFITFSAYYPALNHDFVRWDDHTHLYENTLVQSLSKDNLISIFKQKVHGVYIPLTILSFAVEYHFFGFDPWIYHFNNVLLHILATILVFFLSRSLGLSLWAAFGVGVLFGLHPAHVESVAWVTERKDVLYAVLYLGALLSYMRYLRPLTDKKNYEPIQHRWFLLTCFLGILSLLAKPMALSLPFILLLFDWFKKRDLQTGLLFEKIPLGAVFAGITSVTYLSFTRIPGQNLMEGVLVWCWCLVFYLRQFFLPWLSVPIVRLPAPIAVHQMEYALSIAVVALLVVAVMRLRRFRWFIFSSGFFFFSIFFLLRMDAQSDTNIVADRFLYLPMLGLLFFLGRVLDRWMAWFKQKGDKVLSMLLVSCFCIVAALYFWQTRRQVDVWQNDMTLWEHQLKYYPQEPIALNGLAAALRKEPSFIQAEKAYRALMDMGRKGEVGDYSLGAQQSILKVEYIMNMLLFAHAIAPDYVDISYKLGNLFKDVGLYKEALIYYKKAIDTDPTYKKVYLALGELYHQVGDDRLAVLAITQYVQMRPVLAEDFLKVMRQYSQFLVYVDDPIYREAADNTIQAYIEFMNQQKPRAQLFYVLGALYQESQDFVRALTAYEKALDLGFRKPDIFFHIGQVYGQLQKWHDALNAYEKACQADKSYVQAYVEIGHIHLRQGKIEKAMDVYRQAIQVNSLYAPAHMSLAYVYEQQGFLRQAEKHYQKTIKLNPLNMEAMYNLGNVYLNLNKPQAAVRMYLDVVAVNPNHLNAWVNLTITSFNLKDYQKASVYYDEAVLLGFEPEEHLKEAIFSYRASQNQ